MVDITTAQLQHLAPNARTSYRAAFNHAGQVLGQYAINTTPRRLAHFMAQVLHETGGLTILVENMNYRAERLVQVFKKYFPTVEAAREYAHQPERIANKVYGGRMGNNLDGDGWRYRGRGLLQITGRESYQRIGQQLGINLVAQPDLALDEHHMLAIAAVEWDRGKCNTAADADDCPRVTKIINGGQNGLADRLDWLAKAKHVWA
jgi:putative chitinase